MQSVDARDYAPKDKHPKILSTFMNLKVGESMLLINDHDPKPLYYQFSAEYSGTFEWSYQQKGPEIFEVIIKKVKETNS